MEKQKQDEFRAIRQGEYRGGIWYPANKINNNPKGFNKFTKNQIQKLEEKKLSKEEEYTKLKELGHKIWLKKCELLSKAQEIRNLKEEFDKLNNAYFGWDFDISKK
jgi:hypothetical protein